MIPHFSEFLQRYPEWAPFACLVTGKLQMQKLVLTRIVEGALISILATTITIYFGLPMAVAMIAKDVQASQTAFKDHVEWAHIQVQKRDDELRTAKADTLRNDDEIIARLQRIENCLMVRTCGK